MRCGLVLALALTLTACGGDDGNGPTGPSTPVTGPPGTTINITSSGVSPQTLTVPAGTRVTFTNNDGRPHEMASNPHPEHTDCPELNQVGHLESGQLRESGNLNTRRTCQFHDHINPNSSQFFGSIVIQ
jgi:plastocyanin